jgi:hypothetical protein
MDRAAGRQLACLALGESSTRLLTPQSDVVARSSLRRRKYGASEKVEDRRVGRAFRVD